MNYWITFGVCGLFIIPFIVMAVSLGNTVKGKIKIAIICLVFWVFISGAIWAQSVSETEKWNDGFCECGAHWELKGVTKTKMGSKTKYYSCPECYKEIEINY